MCGVIQLDAADAKALCTCSGCKLMRIKANRTLPLQGLGEAHASIHDTCKQSARHQAVSIHCRKQAGVQDKLLESAFWGIWCIIRSCVVSRLRQLACMVAM